MGLITWGRAYKVGGCISLYQVLDGCFIKVTTIEEVLFGGAKGGYGHLVEVAV